MELREVDSNRPAVRDVIRVDQMFSGERLDQLPDVIVCWAGDRPVMGLTSPRIGVIRGAMHEKRSGDDRSDGFLSLTGCTGLDTIGPDATPDLMDLAPTITELLGGKPDGRFDGHSILRETEDQAGSTC